VGEKSFGFKLDDMELGLVENGGMAVAFKRFGKGIFDKLAMFTARSGEPKRVEEMAVIEPKDEGLGAGIGPKELQW
jgi:hypothetical protein